MNKNREPRKSDVIEVALESPKVDPYLRHEYSQVKGVVGFDPNVVKVPFLSRVKNEGVKIKNTLSRIGNIVGVFTPWSEVPDVVNNEDVINLEASR